MEIEMGTVVQKKLTFLEIMGMGDYAFERLMRRTFESDLSHLTAQERQEIDLRIAHLQKGYMRGIHSF